MEKWKCKNEAKVSTYLGAWWLSVDLPTFLCPRPGPGPRDNPHKLDAGEGEKSGEAEDHEYGDHNAAGGRHDVFDSGQFVDLRRLFWCALEGVGGKCHRLGKLRRSLGTDQSSPQSLI